VLQTLLAPLTVLAGAALPPHPDPLTNRQVLYGTTHGCDRTDDLVSGHEWVVGEPEIIIDQVDVRVADPTMRDRHIDFAVSQGSGFVDPRRKRLTRTVGSIGEDRHVRTHRAVHHFVWRIY